MQQQKRDHFADLELLRRWAQRPSAPLAEAADPAVAAAATSVPAHRPGLYAHLPQGTHLWQQRGVFTLLDRDELGRVLPYLDE